MLSCVFFGFFLEEKMKKFLVTLNFGGSFLTKFRHGCREFNQQHKHIYYYETD